jgi:ACS family D-galactonate transporter-like MFS transporter
LTVGTLINYLDRTVISVAAPLLSHDLGSSAVAMGVVFLRLFVDVRGCADSGRHRARSIGVRLTYFLSVTIWSGVHAAARPDDEPVVADRMPDGLGIAEAPAFPSNSRILGTGFRRPSARRQRACTRSASTSARVPESVPVLDRRHFRLARVC